MGYKDRGNISGKNWTGYDTDWRAEPIKNTEKETSTKPSALMDFTKVAFAGMKNLFSNLLNATTVAAFFIATNPHNAIEKIQNIDLLSEQNTEIAPSHSIRPAPRPGN